MRGDNVLRLPATSIVKEDLIGHAQLDLFERLDRNSRSFCVISVDQVKLRELIELIEKVNVRVIIDLRDLAIFGETIRDHNSFFYLIESKNILYVEFAFLFANEIRLKSRRRISLLRRIVRNITDAASRGVCLILADDARLVPDRIRRARSVIAHRRKRYVELHPSSLKTVGSW